MIANCRTTFSKNLLTLLLFLLCAMAAAQTGAAAPDRWSEQKANTWYQQQPWLVGSDYIPADAINELEMWQAETFDPQQIDKELGWAESLGMNTMRVFLHDLVWKQDPQGFTQRINAFLNIADKHHIRPMFVLFDSVWDPNWDRSTRLFPAFTTPDGYKARELTHCAIRRSIRGSKPMFAAWSMRSAMIAACLPGTYGMSRTIRTASLIPKWNQRTSRSWCWLSCRRSTLGRGRRA
jgi:hypothetical protein